MSLVILGPFLSLFQGICGFGKERKSLVNLRVFLDNNQKNQGTEGQGGAYQSLAQKMKVPFSAIFSFFLQF